MGEEVVELKLPEFAFLRASGHENANLLKGRDVILHIRSASVVEVFEWGNVALKTEVPSYRFTYAYGNGESKRMVIALHYSATLDIKYDLEMIVTQVLIPASRWFCDHLTWEEGRNNILTYGVN